MKPRDIRPLQLFLVFMAINMLLMSIFIASPIQTNVLSYNSDNTESSYNEQLLLSFGALSSSEHTFNYRGLLATSNFGHGHSPSALSVESIGKEPDLYYVYLSLFAYSEPNFLSQRLFGFCEPQYVRNLTHCSLSHSWGFIATNFGCSWVYPEDNLRFIERRLGLFESKKSSYPVGYIDPQIVTVLEVHDDWFLIDTAQGPKWIHLNFMPSTYHLDALLRPFSNSLSVYFYNVETGFSYIHNPTRRYFSASVTKAVYSLYIYQKAERGEVNLDSYITFTQADFLGGSGVIWRNYPVGTQFTQRELLRKNLMYSDNVATLMLRRVHGMEGYRQFIASLGANPDNVHNNVFNSFLNVREAGIFMRAIHEYIESGSDYSEEFRLNLLSNQYPFIPSDYLVASKTGWTYPYAWHAMSIVYAPSPYILVILSRGRSGTSRDYQVFADVSMAFQDFNSVWFTPNRSSEVECDCIDGHYNVSPMNAKY